MMVLAESLSVSSHWSVLVGLLCINTRYTKVYSMLLIVLLYMIIQVLQLLGKLFNA